MGATVAVDAQSSSLGAATVTRDGRFHKQPE